jgi:5-oxopent-3-ene-1,2,5-tricarboxylate decarboxylase / 2-hydroxyhepta-2,4-diene-1,7-dioate isomerase
MNSPVCTLPFSALQTVYGSLMHHRAELAAIGDAVHQPPYNAPPKAPVLYIKPANTFCAFGETMRLPAAQPQIHARACVGLIYQPNRPVAGINTAQGAIKNIVLQDWQYALLCDFTLPHSSFYRPPLRFNALDGSLAAPQNWFAWPDDGLRSERIETWVNGELVHSYQTADWLRSAQDHLHAVSEFIAWETGDVLMLGCPPDAPLVKAGDVVETRMNGHTFTRTTITQEAA